MDLFEYNRSLRGNVDSPLAARMRPKTLEEFVGQEHIVGKDKLLYRAIKGDRISSVIFYGPPGTGKTTLAKIVANTTKSEFRQINATTAGIKDIKDVVSDAKDRQGMYGTKTILFIDEIHRFNKTQQDALLPHVEDGTIILIGATTENPYFEVNKALVSRSVIFQLNPLEQKDIEKLLIWAMEDIERGMGAYQGEIDDDALAFLADTANGDARTALNALELAILTTDKGKNGKIHITLSVAEECIQKRALNYDKNGDNHYDTISAFIKSMRGSDPDAALYYLAKMIYAGEDPKFIARRVVICASEDVGNADPHALQLAVAAMQAVNFVGLPEGRIPLAQAVTYVACAPKSNAAYVGIDKALSDVKNTRIRTVPPHLKDAHNGSKELGNGIGYKYAHAYPNHYVKQQYLPDELEGTTYYELSDSGVERRMKEHMKRLKENIERK
ncbi:AAA family ATPase [Anaerotignum sp.]|uniref:AAA family ATPase n=1 Tax=Anaerotignum sp. TaxID=2039241 RepID=UPI0027153A9C|nr:AAA family ATPase [Anaerotignum sp.]